MDRDTIPNSEYLKQLSEEDTTAFFHALGAQLNERMHQERVTLKTLSMMVGYSLPFIRNKLLSGEVRSMAPYLRCFRVLHAKVVPITHRVF